MKRQEMIETILKRVIERQSFADFYEGEDSPFVKFIEGAEDAPSHGQILDEIDHLFDPILPKEGK